MNDICDKIHKLSNSLYRYTFYSGLDNIPLNGIYIIFEHGEHGHGLDRIVRIGTHTGENQLPSRIKQHFINKNKNRSIFRKNIGRCFLNGHDYAEKWEYDTTSYENKVKYSPLLDADFEKAIEEEISMYIQKYLSFVIIPILSKSERMQLESKLIGTISHCNECIPSAKWMGLKSPIVKIKKSGLWQVQGLYGSCLTQIDFDAIEKAT